MPTAKPARPIFFPGMISALPPLHELARNAGLDLPTYLGELQREAEKSAGKPPPAPPSSTPPAPAKAKHENATAAEPTAET